MASGHRYMKTSTRDALLYVTAGVVTVLLIWGIGKYVNKTSERKGEKNKNALLDMETARADSAENAAKTYMLQNAMLKHERDSLAAGWDDCRDGKKPIVPKTGTTKSTSTQSVASESQTSKMVMQPIPIQPMSVIEKPKEPIVNIEQKPQNLDDDKTDVNVNSPYNTINISNGGVINNYFGQDCQSKQEYQQAKQEYVQEYQRDLESYKKEYQRDLDSYKKTIYKRVRCK